MEINWAKTGQASLLHLYASLRTDCPDRKGSFGVVYKCRLKQTGQFVAVKQISTYGKSSSELAALNSEISLLKEINHPNTIRFLNPLKRMAALSSSPSWLSPTFTVSLPATGRLILRLFKRCAFSCLMF